MLWAGQAYGLDPTADRRSGASLAVCIRMGACEGRLEDLLLAELPAGAVLRNEMAALCPRILAVLTREDVDAFAPTGRPERPLALEASLDGPAPSRAFAWCLRRSPSTSPSAVPG